MTKKHSRDIANLFWADEAKDTKKCTIGELSNGTYIVDYQILPTQRTYQPSVLE